MPEAVIDRVLVALPVEDASDDGVAVDENEAVGVGAAELVAERVAPADIVGEDVLVTVADGDVEAESVERAEPEGRLDAVRLAVAVPDALVPASLRGPPCPGEVDDSWCRGAAEACGPSAGAERLRVPPSRSPRK